MRMCPTKELSEGMILGRSIYQANGRLLLSAGYRINQDVKTRLLDRNYPFVYIMESGTEDVIPEDVISDEIRLQSLAMLEDKAEKVKKTFSSSLSAATMSTVCSKTVISRMWTSRATGEW